MKKYFVFLPSEMDRIYRRTLLTIDTKKISLEEAVLENYIYISKFLKSRKKALRSMIFLYSYLKNNFKVRDYQPKDIHKYNKFKEFIKKAERDIKGKGEISEETADIIMKLFKKK
ncbi:MAG: hypothetical protein OH354_02680 [Candidatus Parvarchaeota archaeon]|nr:hypothetical protein [Candidatus Jingweiarchaeum tengchongense]MCW1309151.1 hypothetical protein [Candidatus Jingweiarchaeum tengchongense]